MKRYILFILLITSSTMILNAQESTIIEVNASCSDSLNLFSREFYSADSKIEKFTIKINSKKLNLSEDAIEDIPDGYVSIREDRHYLKMRDDIYNLRGAVEHSRKDKINQFTSHIYNKSNGLIKTEELYSLKNTKDLKYIQKITLKYGSNKTNIIDVHFDENLFNKEHQKCKEQIYESRKEIYLQSSILILFILGILYIFKRKSKYLNKD